MTRTLEIPDAVLAAIDDLAADGPEDTFTETKKATLRAAILAALREAMKPTEAEEIAKEAYEGQVRRVVTALASGKAMCGVHPRAPATCVGAYEGPEHLGFGCEACCSHGNEDGWCVPVAPAPSTTRAPVPRCADCQCGWEEGTYDVDCECRCHTDPTYKPLDAPSTTRAPGGGPAVLCDVCAEPADPETAYVECAKCFRPNGLIEAERAVVESAIGLTEDWERNRWFPSDRAWALHLKSKVERLMTQVRAPAVLPEERGTAGWGWCPNTSLRIPKGECGCCTDPAAPETPATDACLDPDCRDGWHAIGCPKRPPAPPCTCKMPIGFGRSFKGFMAPDPKCAFHAPSPGATRGDGGGSHV